MRLTTISLRPKYKWGRRTPHSAPGYSSCSPSCGRPGGSRCLPGLPWAPLQTAAKPPPEPARPHPLPGCSLPRGGGRTSVLLQLARTVTPPWDPSVAQDGSWEAPFPLLRQLGASRVTTSPHHPEATDFRNVPADTLEFTSDLWGRRTGYR